MMDFSKSMAVAASGMRAQTDRMKTIAENIANANSTSPTKGGDPYRRKIATITPDFDRELDATLVNAGKPMPDKSDFRSQYDPGNPNADSQGYVKLPNVDSLVEIMDMREAQRSYEADLSVMESTKQMLAKTVDLLNK
jgi:flagellar basal-body rod protein FlgC